MATDSNKLYDDFQTTIDKDCRQGSSMTHQKSFMPSSKRMNTDQSFYGEWNIIHMHFFKNIIRIYI